MHEKGYILYNEEMGVYLGSCLGLGFWSKLDPVGQDAAICFREKEDASPIIKVTKSDYDFHLLEADNDKNGYSSIASCQRAGATPWNPDDECSF